jgi:hypothetical protein
MIIEITETLQAVGVFELRIRHRRAQPHAGQSFGGSGQRSRRGIGLDPEPAVLERIGRQRYATTRRGPVESFPIDIESTAIERSETGQDLVRLTSPAEGAEPRLGVRVTILPRERQQSAAGSDFDRVGYAGLTEDLHPLGKPHGTERVVTPVARIRRALHRLRGDGRDPRDGRRLALRGRCDRNEGVGSRPHQRGVEGVGDAQQSAPNAESFKSRNESSDCVPRARDHRVGWPVQCSDRNVCPVALLDLGRDGRFVGEDSGHDAAPWQALHEARSLRDQLERLLQRVHARAIGGRELADAVPEDGVRNDAPGAPQRHEARLHRE